MIDEVSRVVRRPNDPDLETTLFHPREMTHAEGGIPGIICTRPLAVIFVVKWVKILYAVLNVCVAAPDTKTIIKRYRSDKDTHDALLHVAVVAETEYFGLSRVTFVIEQMTSQEYVEKTDPTKVFDDFTTKWDRCAMMKP